MLFAAPSMIKILATLSNYLAKQLDVDKGIAIYHWFPNFSFTSLMQASWLLDNKITCIGRL